MSFSNTQNTVAISVVASSAAVQIAATNSIAPATKCRISNTSATLYIGVNFGVVGVTAAFPTAGTAGGSAMTAVIPPMGVMVVDVPLGSTHVAAIGSAAGPTYASFAFGMES